MKILFISLLLILGVSNVASAVSFSADAVQIRGGQFSHARMFWKDGKVRYEYLEDGVLMAQIFDKAKARLTWLDTENKLYLQKAMTPEQMRDPVLDSVKGNSNPCITFIGAECTRLKETTINNRRAVKWLITIDDHGRDRHIFQWLDKKLNIPLRQENPDGSIMDAEIQDGVDLNGRKARKQEIYLVHL